ncbi:MAG: hypothetical protein EXR76_17120, partial [Myxococcales bacterium]|nr:hypothetical protein [Myxococcales bacterium]
YERASGRQGLRSGHRSHTIAFGLGPVEVRIPKPRSGPSRPEWLSVLKAVPDKLVELRMKGAPIDGFRPAAKRKNRR